jgi:Zn finger protein HypA/HybF involved in hydrogenase expression
MAPIPSDRKGLTLKYSSGIAPLVTAKQYSDLIANYKQTGQFPHILNLGGMAIDTSRNRNKWRVPLEDLQAIADQLKGLPLMKDHDIDHVDSIIGKVEEAWVEVDKLDPTAGKVFWKGETSDESLIQKILLGYIKHNSIQIAVPNAYCDDCMSGQGKKEEEATIDDLDAPCPRCGSLNMLIRHPMALEQSIIAIPAYEHADITPYGFKASMDFALRARYEPKEALAVAKPVPKVAKVAVPDFMPTLFKAYNAVGMATIEVAEMQLRMAKMALEGYPEDRVEIRYSQKARDLGADKPTEDKGLSPEQLDFLASLPDVYTAEELNKETAKEHTPEVESGMSEEAKGGSLEDFPLVEKKGKGEATTCPQCGSTKVTDVADTTIEGGEGPILECESCGYNLTEGSPLSEEALEKCPVCGMEYDPEIEEKPCHCDPTFYPEPEEADALGIPRPEQEEADPKKQYRCPCGCGQMVDEETYLDVIGRDETPDIFGN